MKNHYYLFLLFSISVFTHAQELDFIQYSDISSIPQIVLNPNRTSNIVKAWLSKISGGVSKSMLVNSVNREIENK